MKLKNLLISSFLIVGIGLLHHPVTSHAIQYEQEWKKNILGNGYEELYSMTQTSDGGFIGVGLSASTDIGIQNKGGYDAIIIKYDKDGNQEWIQSWGGSKKDVFNDVIELDDGGFIAVGYTLSKDTELIHSGYYSAIIVKYDKNGTQEWSKVWGGNSDDSFDVITTTSDGGFVVAGSSDSTDTEVINKGSYDLIISKYNENGEKQWIYSWGEGGFESAVDMVETNDKGIVIIGGTTPSDDYWAENGLILKLNQNGEKEWENFLDGDVEDYFNSVITLADGSFLVAGTSYSTDVGFDNQGESDAIVVKYNKDGRQEFIKSWGGKYYDYFNDIIQTKDGGFAVIGTLSEGYNSSYGIITKYDNQFKQEWIQEWNYPTQNKGVELIEISNNELITLGSSYWRETNNSDVLIFKYTPKTNSDVQINGTIQTMVADVTIPSVSPDLVINPNLPEGFVAPEFSVSNDSVSPIRLELKTFEQTTNTFNDVLPTKYDTWIGLDKQQSQDIALGLVAKEGDGWQTLTTPTSYVANHTDHEIGIIKPTSRVDFNFDVKHGTAFSEAKTVQYKMVFVFDLMN